MNMNMNVMLEQMCYIEDGDIVLNYSQFKLIASKHTYTMVLQFICNVVDNLLKFKSQLIIHIDMQKLTIGDIDKHYAFMKHLSQYMQTMYPNKLAKCYIYKAPFVFSKLYKLVSLCIDKDTLQKIEMVN